MKTQLASNIHFDKKIIGIIPARYGSTRFPGKILASIAGKSLIQRTYENASQNSIFQRLIIATDDDRIYQHVKTFGAEVVMTSVNCPTGADRLVEAIKLNPALADADIIVNVQGDEPCLDPEIITQIVNLLINDPEAVMSTAAIQITSEEEAHNPSAVKCIIDNQQNALYFSRALIPAGHSGKMLPDTTYYRHIGIYAYRPKFLLKYADLPRTPLQLAEDLEQLKVIEHGFRIKVAIVDSFSIGVDTPKDIQKVEQWLHKQSTFLSQAVSAPLSVKD